MKLLTYKTNESEPRLGFIHNNQVVDMEDFGEISNFPLPTTMLELIDMGIEVITEINDLIADTNAIELAEISYDIKEVIFMAPIPKPRKNIIGIGLNYTKHIAESARTLDTSSELPQEPVIFSKPPTCVTATNTDILLNKKLTKQLDWEVELAVVISKKAKYVTKADAMDYVFGYTIINDISARDCRRSGQWIVSKGQDTFAPMGPVLITKDEIENPHNLNLSLTVNGVEKQNSNTQFMLFNIHDLIEDLSTVFYFRSRRYYCNWHSCWSCCGKKSSRMAKRRRCNSMYCGRNWVDRKHR